MARYFDCYKNLDIRGKVPGELNNEIAYLTGRAFADEINPKVVCIGYDIRLSGPEMAAHLAKGLTDAGVDVIDLGMVGTEMVYFATGHYGYDGGIMITASHNPPEYNGMKLVKHEARPISGDSGLFEIEERAHKQQWERTGNGTVTKKDVYADFVQHLLGFAPVSEMRALKVLADPGNGGAGLAMDALIPFMPTQVTKIRWAADGTFPHGVPNPILPEARKMTEDALKAGDFDFGVAWDGDYDRCFFLTEKGEFIEGYYIVALLAQALLKRQPGSKIVYDIRLTWNTEDEVAAAGGVPVMSKSGHSYIKERMRLEDAVYGGEMSAHHYFKQHFYCDSGMVPYVLLCHLLSQTEKTLGQLVEEMMRSYPCSGEINSKVPDVKAVLQKVEEMYTPGSTRVHHTDGLSIDYADWRFNLRGSNTEPLIRLNVESRGDTKLVEEKTAELLKVIRGE